ncbi:hypothetical protein ACHAP7_012294 [Fusarium lateritium]
MLSGQVLAVIIVVSTLTFTYFAMAVIYNLFLHPLRNFPGPLLMRATRLPYAYKVITGTLPFEILNLHNEYGNVVRVAPNELVFLGEESWKDIMRYRTRGLPEFSKPRFFYSPTNAPTNIVSSNGLEHDMLRKQMAPGFSDRSLRCQQPIITRYIDLLILQLRERCKSGSVDLMSYYNFTTFDIIGDLAFGEPFGCLEKSEYSPWIRNIFAVIKIATIVQQATQFPLLGPLLVRILTSPAVRSRQESYREMTRQKVMSRIEAGKSRERPDLMEGLLKKQDGWDMSLAHLERNASSLIVAGSETTATALSGITYLLAQNHEALRKLTQEVRSGFYKEEDIDFISVNKLAYLMACIEEGLRMYPPAPGGLPRVTPEEGGLVSGHFVPKNSIVSIHHWATYHSEKNFKKPFEFHPERLLGDQAFKSDRHDTLQPFHIGPRGCMGRNLAYVEMKVILARMIWNFNLTLVPECGQWMENQKIYNLWEKRPLMFNLEPTQDF